MPQSVKRVNQLIFLVATLFIFTIFFSVLPCSVYATTIEVSSPTQITTDTHYDRNPSIFRANDGKYWLFFARSWDGDPNYGASCLGKGCDATGCNCDAAAYDIYYMISNDNGVTWSSETKLTACSVGKRGMDAFQDSSGKFWVFVSDPGPNNKIEYCTSDDAGITWNGPIDTGLTGSHVDALQLSNSYSMNGWIYLVYESSGIQGAWSSDDGVTWSSATIDGSSGMGIPKAMDVDDKFQVVYISWNSPGDLYYKVYDWATSSWDVTKMLQHRTPLIGSDPVIYKKDSTYGIFWAPWDSGTNSQWIEVLTSDDGGNTWSSTKRVTNGGYDTTYWWDMWPDVLVDGSNLYLFYASERGSRIDGNILMYKVDWNLANDHYDAIRPAITTANTNDHINVDSGTYTETGQIVISKDLSIFGAGPTNTIIKPAQDTGSSGDSKGWFLVNTGIEFKLRGVTLDGTGHKIWQAIRDYGTGVIEDCKFVNIKYEAYQGTAIAAFTLTSIPGNIDVKNCEFSEIGRIGILYYGTGKTGTYSDNTYVGKGTGDWLDYGVEVGAGAQVTIENNKISNCKGVASVDNSTSAGILVTTYYGAGTQATITKNTISNSEAAIGVGYDSSDTSVVTANYNNFLGNNYGTDSTAPLIDAILNWWGDATGPEDLSGTNEVPPCTNDPTTEKNSDGLGDKVSDKVDYCPWLTSPINFEDKKRPKVTSFATSNHSPIKSGPVDFIVTFDEDMNIFVQPEAKLIGSSVTIPPKTGSGLTNGWQDTKTWIGQLVVTNTVPGDGKYDFRISNAEDIIGNKMETFTKKDLIIDTTSPQILQTFVPDIFGNQNLTLAISAFDPGSSGVVRITASIDGGVEQNMTFAFREQQKIAGKKTDVDKYFLTITGSSLSSATHNVVFKVYDNTSNQNVSSPIQFKRDSTVKISGGSIAFLCKKDPVSEVVRKFDFGTKNSPLQTGYTRVTHDTLYPTGSGYGWSSAAFGSLDRGVGDKLTRDFVFDFDTATKEFRVSLPSDTYNVTVLMGDTLFTHDDMSVTIEGHPNTNIDTSVDQIKTITNVVNVTDGQLNIVFGDAGGTDPNWVVNAIEISTKPICIDGIEKQTINWLKSKGWTVDFDKYSDWTLASLITHKLIICSDQENACKPTSAVSSAHKINKIPFVEIPDSTSAKAAAGFSYLTAPGGTRSQPTANEFFENPESISTGFFGSTQILTSPQKLTRITGKMATYVKDIAAPDDSPKYTNMFKADESGTRGRFVFVGWFFGRTTSSGFIGWSASDLSSNGQLILQRAVNWAQCGNPTGCI